MSTQSATSQVTKALSKTLKRVKSKVNTGLSSDGTPVVKRISPPKGSGDHGKTSLPSGTPVSKGIKVFAATGVLEELVASIGILKARYFPAESSSSRKMFIFARLTKIQEDLFAIITSVLATPDMGAKFTNSRFDPERKEELKSAIISMNVTPFSGLPGQSPLEADLYMTWAITRRAERQLAGIKEPKIGIIPEPTVMAYTNLLSDYFLHLISHTRALADTPVIKE